MIETDVLIIGAGPVGLFTVFEAGLIKLKCHLIDYLPIPGGQCAEIYPKKPIYDIPGIPSILAGDLIDNLMKQIEPFKPGFTLGERAEIIEVTPEGKFLVITNRGTKHLAANIAIAGGLGCFEPRRPAIENLSMYEDHGVEYIIKEPEFYRDKNIVIAGGGDSALDWSIFLTDVAKCVTLIHRSEKFRGALDSVEKVHALVEQGKMKLLTNAEVVGIGGDKKVESISIAQQGEAPFIQNTDHFIPLFGLLPKLGPIGEWGLDIEKGAIRVNTEDYSTNIPGIYAIGDVNTYEGKLKLILCGFHEGTLAVQSMYKRLNPNKNLVLKYTTVNGVNGF